MATAIMTRAAKSPTSCEPKDWPADGRGDQMLVSRSSPDDCVESVTETERAGMSGSNEGAAPG